jgi:hypothetical protein
MGYDCDVVTVWDIEIEGVTTRMFYADSIEQD